MKIKWLIATAVICVGAGSLAMVQGSETQVENAEHNAVAGTTDQDIYQTLIAGLKARESSITSASAYLVNERYYNDSTDLQQAYQSDAAADPAMKSWAQILQGKPKFLVKFWATDGAKVREDEKPFVEEPGAQTAAAFDGERTQILFVENNLVEQRDLDSWPMNATARLLQLPSGANAPRLSELMKKRHAHFVGKEMMGGLEVYKVESQPSSSGTVETWWIAPSRGYVVVRGESRSKKMTENGPVTSWRLVNVVDKLAQSEGGEWIPAESRSIKYVTLGTKEMWETIVQNSLLSLQINSTLPEQIFSLPLPPGSKVGRTEMEGGSYTVPGNKKQFASELQEAKERGEQPDLETLDIRKFEAKLNVGKPNPQDTLDAPADGMIEIIHLPASPSRLPRSNNFANDA